MASHPKEQQEVNQMVKAVLKMRRLSTSQINYERVLKMNKYTKFNLVGELETTMSGKLLYLVLLDLIDEDDKVIIPQKKISETAQKAPQKVAR